MTALGATSNTATNVTTRRVSLVAIGIASATALALLGLALLPLLTPLFIHPALDAASSAAWLGTTPAVAQGLSDETVRQLVFGGTLAIEGPAGGRLYTSDEIAHLRDARVLLYAFLAVAAVSAIGVGIAVARASDRRAVYRAVSAGAGGLVVGVVVLGVAGFFAFEPAFELFHRIFFPGGNWSFDPGTSHLVQLYPYAFWQIAAGALAAIAASLGLAIWWLARRGAAR